MSSLCVPSQADSGLDEHSLEVQTFIRMKATSTQVCKISRWSAFIVVSLSLVLLEGALFLFLSETVTGFPMLGSIARKDLIGNRYPLEEWVISQETLAGGNVMVTSICKRQLAFYYSISLRVENMPDGKNIRLFVADKDTEQDCNEYNIDSLLIDPDRSEIIINFRNQETTRSELPR